MSDTLIMILLITSIAVTFLAVAFGYELGIDYMEAKTAKTSCAQYNPESGYFEWLEKADE